MKKLMLLCLVLVGCQKQVRNLAGISNGVDGLEGSAGSSCSVVQTETGATISCTDGTSAEISNGNQGETGETGSAGSNGLSAFELWLNAGNEGTLSDFLGSLVGEQGQIGNSGADGTSCSVTQLLNGILITCGESSGVVLNGLNGQDGAAGEDGSDGVDGQNGANGHDALAGFIGIAAILNPCGVNGAHEEVLLKLSNGKVLALYDGGPNLDRFSLLLANTSYGTTDGFSCHFSINANGDLN